MMKGMIIMKLKNIMNDDVMKATFTGVIATIIVTWIITPLANHIFPAILSLLNSFSSSFSDYLPLYVLSLSRKHGFICPAVYK